HLRQQVRPGWHRQRALEHQEAALALDRHGHAEAEQARAHDPERAVSREQVAGGVAIAGIEHHPEQQIEQRREQDRRQREDRRAQQVQELVLRLQRVAAQRAVADGFDGGVHHAASLCVFPLTSSRVSSRNASARPARCTSSSDSAASPASRRRTTASAASVTISTPSRPWERPWPRPGVAATGIAAMAAPTAGPVSSATPAPVAPATAVPAAPAAAASVAPAAAAASASAS